MLDTLELPLVQRIDGSESEALEQHGVPGLEGDFLQDLGRRAVRIELSGVLTGPEAAGGLKSLREKHQAAAPVSFVADVATATKVSQMLIEGLRVREIAGRTQRFEYEIGLVEYIPPPPPQQEPPPVPPKPPSTTTGALVVTVIVDGEPDFDFSGTTVRIAGTRSDGSTLSQELTQRTDNVWTNDPTPPGSYTATATVDDPPLSGSASATVVAGQTARVEIHLQPGAPVARAFVVHYWFDKAIVEPCLRRVLRDAVAYSQAHPEEKMLIVGHTDLVGSDDYNQSLSERRARGVHAYLTAGRDHAGALAEWNALRKAGGALPTLGDNWSVREYQLLLQGLGYYGGAIDEVHGALTDAAVRNFQSDHGLGVDGVVGDDTWNQMIDAYLGVDALAVPESQFLPNCSGEVLKWLGCGEKDPVRNTEDAWRPNRRTEILFVRASALPGKVAPPVTFQLPVPGAVNAGWCAGADGDTRIILSRGPQQEHTFLVQPAEPGSVVVQGSMTFEDGSPSAAVSYVLTAPDGEYMDGERPSGPTRGRPIPGISGADGRFAYPDKPKGVGVYVLSVDGRFSVRLKQAAPNSGRTPTLCVKLDGGGALDVVLAPADGVDPRHKLAATLLDRAFTPRASIPVTLEFPDGSSAQGDTDAQGRLAAVMGGAFDTVTLRYQASDDANDILALPYFIDVGDIAADAGVLRRLHNLGLEPEAGLAAAIAVFQANQGLNPTGEMDAQTRARLGAVYAGDEPLVPEYGDTPSGPPPDAPNDP
jgi:outer membrane protein OmpA-like peptidoglycan-associated protein